MKDNKNKLTEKSRVKDLRFACEQLLDFIHSIWDYIPEDDRQKENQYLKSAEKVIYSVELEKEVKWKKIT